MEKTKNKERAFNKNLWLALFLFAVFVYFSIACAAEREWGLFVGFSLFALFTFFVMLIQPIVITFSEDSIEIIYMVGVKETIPTRQIRKIYKDGDWFVGHNGWPVYVVVYPCSSKKLFFVNGEIPRTRRTKQLLKQYYQEDFEE